MPHGQAATEHTALLYRVANDRRLSELQREQDEEARSILSLSLTKEEQAMAGSTVGERLPYNNYTTIDWLHDLVKDSYRFRYIQSRRGLRYHAISLFEACSGWIAVVIIGTITAFIAFVVDVSMVTVSDWKQGYCTTNPFLSMEACCEDEPPLLLSEPGLAGQCKEFHKWTPNFGGAFAIHVAMAIGFGIISSSATMLTKSSLPAVASDQSSKGTDDGDPPLQKRPAVGKSMYMAAGSGIPEIKTILSGFVIPDFLSFRVLLVKAFGAIFAVSSSLCLGKEGPFVHISACVGYIVGNWFPKYKDNGRKMRELLSSACASSLSVAFGAPIGGVLFSYEEISTYFPRKVLWKAFLCSMFAAIILKVLNPMGTGKIVLFETNYGSDYQPVHYIVFAFLGVAGGIFGGLFCKLNFLWSKWFRSLPLIKANPVLEVVLVVLFTASLQFPNPLIRDTGERIIKRLLVDCKPGTASASTWICQNEAVGVDVGKANWPYIGHLLYGTVAKLVLTIIAFGTKVPSGVIIPALDAGALFGRLIGQSVGSISPGIFALVGAAAFLAGVCRMTISLAVIMFELTGQLEYVVPQMAAILISKWVADAISSESVYDLAQNVLGHPFLDPDVAINTVRRRNLLVQVLIPPPNTMAEITVRVPPSNKVPYALLRTKLEQLKSRGLMDAGLVLVQSHPPSRVPILQGYISQPELEFGLTKLLPHHHPTDPSSPYEHPDVDFEIRLLGHLTDDDPAPETLEVDLTPFVDRTPLSICAKAPLEYAVEMFARLGLRYLCVTEEGTGALVGVIVKKRLVGYLEKLKERGDEDD